MGRRSIDSDFARWPRAWLGGEIGSVPRIAAEAENHQAIFGGSFLWREMDTFQAHPVGSFNLKLG